MQSPHYKILIPYAKPKLLGLHSFFDVVDRTLFRICATLGCTYLFLEEARTIKLIFHILDRSWISKNLFTINLSWFGGLKNMVNNWIKGEEKIKPSY